MATQRLNLVDAHLAQARSARGQPVSQILMDRGVVTPQAMLGALAEADRIDQPVARVLEAEALASREDILAAQAARHGALVLRLADTPPDPLAMSLLPADFCLKHGALPWMWLGDTLVVATTRPEAFDALTDRFPEPPMMALTIEEDIHRAIAAAHGAALARAAETLRPEADSCRDLNLATPAARLAGAVMATAVLGCLIFAPTLLFAAALLLALTSLVVAQVMKTAALIASRRHHSPREAPLPIDPPKVSLLVPLFREENIAGTLVKRLSRLSYPRALLDVVLVLEERDARTRAALETADLPPWMRIIEVPDGPITTKPRALNHALRFTSSPIIGIYDAEDSPAPDQLRRVVHHFSRAPPEVGCLQGILDFYNPHANWLSRCFAIEYANWFRVLLPGLSKMGLAVPLGGTTVFFRRAALESVGGWDAHNVTEDADLGILLARRGYRTELVATVTREEANNRFWPWIKQRSRWLKGYAVTWWVHSRRPLRLLKELGPRRFLGMQALFLTTIIQFTLAPVLLSFWLLLLALPHPLAAPELRDLVVLFTTLFLIAEATSIATGLAAVARSPHRRLLIWVPTLYAYFPLASVAMYKGLWELVGNPFYWDKTQHGHSGPDAPDGDLPEGLPGNSRPGNPENL